MSIALQEAKNYQACAGDCMGSDEAYYAGRTAEPTEAEIEAAAITAVNTLHGVYPDSMPCWEDSSEDTQSRAKQYAVYMLEAARKSVSVDE
jgi:hypothetical protein